MRIAIDLRPLQIGHEFRGIGAYLSNILQYFPLDNDEHTFIFVRYHDSNPLDELNLNVLDYKEVVINKPADIRGYRKIFLLLKKKLWRQFGDLSKHRPDVYFQPDFLLGLPRSRGMKKYVVMYDLIPLVLRNTYLPSWKRMLVQPGLGKRRRIRFVGGAWLRERGYKAGLRNVKRADGIFSISQATADDLHRLLRISKHKIIITPLAASLSSQEPRKPKLLNEQRNPFLLYIGGTDQRRRLVDLVCAFNLLNGRGYRLDLVFAGRDFSGPIETMLVDNIETRQAIIDSSYKSQIHLLGYISQAEKSWLLNNAFAFIYPTLYEGFGLPVLEAMAEGCPAISYNNSSLPEIADAAAILLNTPGSVEMCKATADLYDHKVKRDHLIALGKNQAKTFSWQRCADETFKTLVAGSM
jgi:glycosyltransferase involved in cell wall biosynthesis